MGAAIPLALSLALAIRDAIPGGEPPALSSSSDDAAGGQGEGEEEDDARESIVRMQVRTGSKTVADEVTPEDEVHSLSFRSLLLGLTRRPSLSSTAGPRPRVPVPDKEHGERRVVAL